MRTLPTIRYVAIARCYYGWEMYRYIDTAVENFPHTRAVWGVRVVFLSTISNYDWEYGARGLGRFLGRCGTGGKEAH